MRGTITMQLYVIDGTQYAEDKLPEGIDPSEAQTLEEWFAANRKTAPTSFGVDGDTDELAARLAERDATIAALEQQATERDATIATLTATVAERDATIADLTAKPAKGK